jgi:hypothetical protein
VRRQRAFQAVQSTQSTLWVEPAVIDVRARGTEIRNAQITVPLGSTRSTGAVVTRPRNCTELSAASPM